MSFPTSLFDYMASPQQAASELSPAETEHMVLDYLGALDHAMSEKSFDPGGGVNALVFGEWGHGKSQVMYRTADHLMRNHLRVLTVRIIAARLAPRDILEAALFDLSRQPDAKAEAEVLRRSMAEMGDLPDDDPHARQIAARALASMASQTQRLHTALLFDEAAQTSGIDFQEFLRELEHAFSSARSILHTMQCHSLATLDRARHVANNLGDWARSARQIHLPSIQQEHAYDFFHKRLSSRTQDPQLADRLIPPGIAKTLCAAAGGNPRRMLQYASRIWELCREHGERQFTGRRVLEVFSTEAGVTAGTSLFMEARFRRILDLLPQEWGAFGQKVRPFLQNHIDTLLGESEVMSPAQLAAELGNVSVGELQKITREVGGIPLFETKMDEFEDTTYGLTHAFRSDLCGTFGSTGGLDLKQIQIKLLLKPREEQNNIANGLATVLRHKGYTQVAPKIVRLGEFPAEAHSHHQIPIRGFTMQVQIPGTSIDVPVLVTGLCGVAPPCAMIERITRGLVDREWAFAYILYANEELSWDDWLQGDEAKGLPPELQEKASEIRTLNPSEKLVSPSSVEQAHPPSVAAAIFFAHLIGVSQQYAESKQPSEEMIPVIDGTVEAMNKALPQLRDVIYLPSEAEQKLLGHSCWEQASAGDGLTLKQLGEAMPDGRVTGASLANLMGSYLEKSGGLYVRHKSADFPIFGVVRDVLKDRQRCSLDVLTEAVRGVALFVGGGNRLRSNVEWIVEKLRNAGMVRRAQDEFQYIDITKALKEKDEKFKLLLSDYTKRLSLIEQYESSRAEPLQKTLEDIRKRKTFKGAPSERSERLDELLLDLEQLHGRITEEERAIESEKKKYIEHFTRELAELKRLREGLAPEWRNWAFTEDEYLDADKLVEAFQKEIETPVGTNQRSLIRRERITIQSRLDALRVRALGKATAASEDPYTQIVNRVLSKQPFDRLVITVEEF
ncbi:hypothetical protein D7W79_23470 [Corallococcus exercitus]|uniref:hypothetical protein n=1 Tax=Corallococcus exercitus TaxID=2316736 RepID=UPI000EA19BC1|nr:hypothetical protein [Corallococcus exercitus]RKG74222.1 hypothetical protein D7W79_23470 [Corallococcus exercitus]